jgi:hypothetical protein
MLVCWSEFIKNFSRSQIHQTNRTAGPQSDEHKIYSIERKTMMAREKEDKRTSITYCKNYLLTFPPANAILFLSSV